MIRLLFIFLFILLSSKILFAKPCLIDEMQIVTLEKCYVEFDNGSVIINGQFKNGLLNGFAEFYTPEGTENYVGSWLNNKYHGYGLIIFDDASKHLGNWDNGQLRKGIIDYPEAVYTVTLAEEDKTWGTAAFLFENSEAVYVGEVKSSKLDGEGIRYVLKTNLELEITEGQLQIGFFKDNLFISDYSNELPSCEYDLKNEIVTTIDRCFGNQILIKGKEITGVFDNKEPQMGIIKSGDNIRIGRFKSFERDGNSFVKLDGHGFISTAVEYGYKGYMDNTYYIGEFVEGRLTGYGHYTTKDDLQKYYGEFVNFSKNGFGSEYNLVNEPFEFHGIFKDDTFHGYGIFYTVSTDGELITTPGFFQNDEYVHNDKDIVYDNWSDEFAIRWD